MQTISQQTLPLTVDVRTYTCDVCGGTLDVPIFRDFPLDPDAYETYTTNWYNLHGEDFSSDECLQARLTNRIEAKQQAQAAIQ